MYTYELEIQRQRVQRIQIEAEALRLVGNGDRQTTDLRRIVGQQLIKLGTRLQGSAR